MLLLWDFKLALKKQYGDANDLKWVINIHLYGLLHITYMGVHK